MKISRALFIASLLALSTLATYGLQTGEGTGTVTDSTGAVVPEANVTANNSAIWERQSLIFRFETFNTLNHPNWNTPANDPRNLATCASCN